MYTIAMQSNKSLIVTNAVTLYEKETGTDVLRFLIPPQYTEGATVKNLAEYVVVAKIKCSDGRVWTEQLIPEELPYKERLDMRLTIDSDFTRTAGQNLIYLTFAKVIEHEDGTKTSDVFHSGNVLIDINPKEEFIYVPDKTLQVVDQLILSLSEKINQVENIVIEANDNKAEDIEIIDDQIWLVRHDEEGNIIKLGDPIENAKSEWEEM